MERGLIRVKIMLCLHVDSSFRVSGNVGGNIGKQRGLRSDGKPLKKYNSLITSLQVQIASLIGEQQSQSNSRVHDMKSNSAMVSRTLQALHFINNISWQDISMIEYLQITRLKKDNAETLHQGELCDSISSQLLLFAFKNI